MMTTRQSALFAIFLGGLVLATLSGCSAGNPNMSAAESAMEQNNYQRALANVDSAITKDSANVEAYMMKARILRQMADSTTPPDRYKKLHQRAYMAEEKAIKFDPAKRSDIKSQRRLAFIQEFRKAAQQFRRAQDRNDYLRAAAHFGAAGAIQPDSTGPILNEAYARLNAAQRGEGNKSQEMSEVIPLLERYMKTEEAPTKDAYTILTQLYWQTNQPEKVVELTKKAIDDLSNRPTHIRISGSNGLKYSGRVEVGGSSRGVQGTVPDRVPVSADEGVVSGSFWKNRKKGALQVRLLYRGARQASAQARSPSDTASVSKDLTGLTPLAELQNFRLNALNRMGETAEAMKLYRQEIKKEPKNAQYRYNYGSLLLNADRYDAAAKQLKKAAQLDPDDPKKQYNLGAAYLNKGVVFQDSLVALRDSVLNQNRKPTEEEEKMVKELDKKRRQLFMKAIPPLERARRLSQQKDGKYLRDACSALLQAYVQTEQQEKAKRVKKCAGGGGQGGGNQGGGGGF